MKKIVVIEDDYGSAELARCVLERAGYEVYTAEQGFTGIELAAKHQVDLVLLDMNLPDVSGEFVIKFVKRIPGNIPVVMVSGDVDPQVQQRTLHCGASGFITKPISVKEFPRQVAEILKRFASVPTH